MTQRERSKPPSPASGAGAAARDKLVVGASSFTSLWALTWLGTEALPLDPSIQGGFAVGGVMASSGLALLWWKTRTMRQLHPDEEEV